MPDHVEPAFEPVAMGRRRVLSAMLLVPAALAFPACGLTGQRGPDPLIALADQARADAALAAAVIAKQPALTDRLGPVRTARKAHAEALDAEITRSDPNAGQRTQPRSAAPVLKPAPQDQLVDALLTSSRAAATAVLELPTDRVGLATSIAACCGAYAAVLA